MMTPEDRRVLANSKLFHQISFDSVEWVLETCPVSRLASGETLLDPATENQAIYLILEGGLSVQPVDTETFEATQLGPGDCVGEVSMVDGQRPTARVHATADTRVVVLRRSAMWSLINSSHGFAFNLLYFLAGRMRDDNKALESSHTRSLEFEHAASVDALTGLHNRRWLDNAFGRMLRRCRMDAQPVCLLMVDIDHFKIFNDTWGHLAGDVVLRHVSQVLAGKLRPTDLIARYGGEEFSALLPDTALESAALVAERLRAGIAEAPLALPDSGKSVSVTISLGVSQARPDEPVEEMIRRADEALYRAKESGRNRVALAP